MLRVMAHHSPYKGSKKSFKKAIFPKINHKSGFKGMYVQLGDGSIRRAGSIYPSPSPGLLAPLRVEDAKFTITQAPPWT